MSDHVQLSAATVRRTLLDPAIDARELNLDEQRTCYAIAAQLKHLTGGDRQAMALLLRRLAFDNAQEGAHEDAITDTAETLARDLRGAELNAGALELTARAVARRVSGPLDIIANPAAHDSMAFVTAVRAVDDVLARCPRAQLLSPRVKTQLRQRKFDLLTELANRKAADR